jgi:hypothetical protein
MPEASYKANSAAYPAVPCALKKVITSQVPADGNVKVITSTGVVEFIVTSACNICEPNSAATLPLPPAVAIVAQAFPFQK